LPLLELKDVINSILTSNLFIGNTLFYGVLRLPLSESVYLDFLIWDDAFSDIKIAEFLREYLHAALELGNDYVSVGTLDLVDARGRPEYKLCPLLHHCLERGLLQLHGRRRGCGAWGTALSWCCLRGSEPTLRDLEDKRGDLLI
jgi:hypothetical protein